MIRKKLKEIADLQLKHNEWLIKNPHIERIQSPKDYGKYKIQPECQFLEKRKEIAKELSQALESKKAQINKAINNPLFTDELTFFKTSTAQGNYTEYAWSAFLHKIIAKGASAQDAWYPVFLYSSDQQRIYLAIAHSVKGFEGRLDALSQLAIKAAWLIESSLIEPPDFIDRLQMRRQVDTRPDLGPYRDKTNDTGNLYSHSCVAWYEYEVNELPSDENLIQDLISLAVKLPMIVGEEEFITSSFESSQIKDDVSKSDKKKEKKEPRTESTEDLARKAAKKKIAQERKDFVEVEAVRIAKLDIVKRGGTYIREIGDGNPDLENGSYRKSFDLVYEMDGKHIGVEVKGRGSGNIDEVNFSVNELIVHYCVAKKEEILKKISDSSTSSIDLGIKGIPKLSSNELREILHKFDLNEIYRIHVVFHKETSYDEFVKKDLIAFHKGKDIIPSLLGSIPLQFQVTLPTK